MKTTFKIFALATMIFAAGTISAQGLEVNEEKDPKREKKVRPVRLGAKVGFPNLIGGNLEYATPLMNRKLALNLDYSYIKSDWLETQDVEGPAYGYEDEQSSKLIFKYIEGGLNYYFFKPGRGLYGGISYGMINLNGTTSVEDEDNSLRSGTGIVDVSHSSFNVKLGAKLGGLFYFRPEAGYSFSPLPKSYDLEVIFDDGTRKTQTENFETQGPVNLLFSGLMFNLGFGFAF